MKTSKVSIAMPIVLTAAVAFFIATALAFRPQPVWYVDAALANAWTRVLAQSAPPFTRLRPWKAADGIPPGIGVYLTSEDIPGINIPPGGSSELPSFHVRRNLLTQNEKNSEALLVALDPWMVFYKHSDTPPSRVRSEAPGNGIMILAGAEQSAVRAWAAQLLQQSPGLFPQDYDLWEKTKASLLEDPRFQRNAGVYSWAKAVSLLLQEDEAWLYAPLSRIMELPSHKAGLLSARIFPVNARWTEFGVQASLLWAIPAGPPWMRNSLDKAKAWLHDSRTQTLIAHELHWLPARPDSSPYNPLARDAQLAWLSSSFVWGSGE